MTGAVMPAGLDTVVPLELCKADGEQVRIEPGVIKPGENRRKRGEDLARGQARAARRARAAPGRPGPGGLARLRAGARCVRRLRVALFSTGDEVIARASRCRRAASTTATATACCRAAAPGHGGHRPRPGARRPAALQATLERAVAEADVVLTSGGVSAGDADYTRDVLAQMGEVAFWKVAMRPGRPFAFGPLNGPGGRRPGCSRLPGNPVAALVTFYAFAREALLQLAGATPEPMPVLQARSVASASASGRAAPSSSAASSAGADGVWEARLTGSQGAGVLRSMSEANALVVLAARSGLRRRRRAGGRLAVRRPGLAKPRKLSDCAVCGAKAVPSRAAARSRVSRRAPPASRPGVPSRPSVRRPARTGAKPARRWTCPSPADRRARRRPASSSLLRRGRPVAWAARR
jgi:molybdopterin molybdotransferase